METNVKWSEGKEKALINLSKFLQTFSTCVENNSSTSFQNLFYKKKKEICCLLRLNRASNESKGDRG